MPVQAARLANLHIVIRLLKEDGLVTRESQAAFLENAVTAFKLQAMLDGAHIDALFSEHVEHVLFKPRGWMNECHSAEARDMDEPSPEVPS
jgi:hypothetical protein